MQNNAAHLAEYLFENIPSCTITYSCNNCDHNYRRTSPTCNINVDAIIKYGLNNMQEAINDNIIVQKETRCNNCKTRINRTITYGSHLVIDTNIFSDCNYRQAQNIDTKHSYPLNDVSKLVVIDDNQYILSGVISYINGSGFNDGHYVAFTYTGINWYKYDDMASKQCVANENEEICPHVIIYVKL